MDSCSSTCQGMVLPMTDRLLETNMTLQYNYCTNYDSSFMMTVDLCTECLEGVSSARVLANCMYDFCPRDFLLFLLTRKLVADTMSGVD